MDVTDVMASSNFIVFEVDNSIVDNVYPQHADFTFYGGLYRDVNLISVPDAHFDLEYYGGPGIMVTPKPTECGGATFEIEAFVKNADENFTVQYTILDEEGLEVAYASRPASAPKTTIFLPDAQLWDFENPYLYTVEVNRVEHKETLDNISTRFGCRTYVIDPEKGFILNGESYPLRGVSRHQDIMYIGNALDADDHYADVKRIIAACGGKARKITVIMPFLYEGRQHKRTTRESLDCAIALQELINMGVDNIITFDAHDPGVEHALHKTEFDNFFATNVILEDFINNLPEETVAEKEAKTSVREKLKVAVPEREHPPGSSPRGSHYNRCPCRSA